MQIRLEVLNAEKSLLGLDYEIIYFSDKKTVEGNAIVDQYNVISIGIIFLTLVLTFKRRGPSLIVNK